MAKRAGEQETETTALLPELWGEIAMHLVSASEFGAVLNWMGVARWTTEALRPQLNAWFKCLRQTESLFAPTAKELPLFHGARTGFSCNDLVERIERVTSRFARPPAGFYHDVVYTLHLESLHCHYLEESGNKPPQKLDTRGADNVPMGHVFHFDRVARQWTRLDNLPAVRTVEHIPDVVELARILRESPLERHQRLVLRWAVENYNPAWVLRTVYAALRSQLPLVAPSATTPLGAAILGDEHLLSSGNCRFTAALFVYDYGATYCESDVSRLLKFFHGCGARAESEVLRLYCHMAPTNKT